MTPKLYLFEIWQLTLITQGWTHGLYSNFGFQKQPTCPRSYGENNQLLILIR